MSFHFTRLSVACHETFQYWMNSICISRVFPKLLLLGAHSVSMKYCNCCWILVWYNWIFPIEMLLLISCFGQTVILSVLSHLFTPLFSSSSHHEYAMSYLQIWWEMVHAVLFIYMHTYVYLYIFSLCLMRTVISSGHEPKYGVIQMNQEHTKSTMLLRQWYKHNLDALADKSMIVFHVCFN